MSKEWPEITKDTPLSEVQEIHKRIWEYVIWDGRKPHDTPYFDACVLCAYARENFFDILAKLADEGRTLSTNRGKRTVCDLCPAKWPNGKRCPGLSFNDDTLFHRWLEATSEQLAMVYARQIRDLPFYTEEEYTEILKELTDKSIKED